MESAFNAVFLAVFGVSATAAVVARVRGRVLLGLGVRDRPLTDLAKGLAIGTAGMTLTVAALLATGAAGIEDVGLDWSRLGRGFGVLAAAAFGEELAYRALLLTGLIVLTRRPLIALAVSALLFGAVHMIGTAEATAISVASNTLGGVMYAVAYLRTGRLWMPIGLHFAWNFVQGTVFGFTVSAETAYSGALFHPVVTGADWLSGGAYGPEGSVLSLAARLLIIAAVLKVTADRTRTPADRQSRTTGPTRPRRKTRPRPSSRVTDAQREGGTVA